MRILSDGEIKVIVYFFQMFCILSVSINAVIEGNSFFCGRYSLLLFFCNHWAVFWWWISIPDTLCQWRSTYIWVLGLTAIMVWKSNIPHYRSLLKRWLLWRARVDRRPPCGKCLPDGGGTTGNGEAEQTGDTLRRRDGAGSSCVRWRRGNLHWQLFAIWTEMFFPVCLSLSFGGRGRGSLQRLSGVWKFLCRKICLSVCSSVTSRLHNM